MEANKQLAKSLATIAALQVAGRVLVFGGRGGGGGRGSGRGSGWGGRGGRGWGEGQGEMGCTVRLYNNQNYCHTHGYDTHDDHVSDTYNTPAIGHRHNKTFADNKGGLQKHRQLVV